MMQVEAALAAKTGAPGGPFTGADVLNFLANSCVLYVVPLCMCMLPVRCL